METELITETRSPVLGTRIVWFISLAAALGTASIYPLQPAIAQVAGSLHTSVTSIGAVLACGPIGYLVGLALLVPLVDRFAPRVVVAAQFAGLAAALAVAAVVCLALFDAGLFAAQVANQSTVLAIDPAAPARFNSAYMVVYFVGGSSGTAFGAAAVDRFGWSVVAASAALAIAVAAAVTVVVGGSARVRQA